MKKILFTLLLVFPLLVLAQNGGQHHSNQFVSLSNYGWSAGGYDLKISNLQSGPVKFRLSIGGTHIEVGPYAANSITLYKFIAPENCNIKVQCKPLSNVIPGPDMGQVEAKCMEGPDIIPLPVTFLELKIVRRK